MVYSLRSAVYSSTYIACYVFSSACFLLSSWGNSKYSDFEKTESGLSYKFYVRGADTVHPQYGEIVRLKMITLIGDSTLDNSNLIYPDGVRRNLQKPVFKGAISASR